MELGTKVHAMCCYSQSQLSVLALYILLQVSCIEFVLGQQVFTIETSGSWNHPKLESSCKWSHLLLFVTPLCRMIQACSFLFPGIHRPIFSKAMPGLYAKREATLDENREDTWLHIDMVSDECQIRNRECLAGKGTKIRYEEHRMPTRSGEQSSGV